MLKIIMLTILSVLFISCANDCAFEVSGNIYDINNDFINEATVTVKVEGHNYRSNSDENGHFYISTGIIGCAYNEGLDGEYTFNVSKDGYIIYYGECESEEVLTIILEVE